MAETEAPAAPVNYLDVKLHDVHSLPPAWWSDGRPPAFAEHPFRYEVSFSIDGENTYTFKHGRLLQELPQYESYIAGATPPPLPSEVNEMLRHIREVPDSPNLPSAATSKATAASFPRTEGGGEAPVEAKLLWITTPAAEAASVSSEEQGTKRRRRTVSPPAAEEVPPPAVPADEEIPPCVIRVPLEEQHVAALESLVLSGKPLELRFARVLKGGVPTDWEDTQQWYFRAVIPVDLAPFAEPGSLQLIEAVPLLPLKEPAQAEEKGRKKSSKRPKSAAPSLLFEEPDMEAQHPYVTYNTSALVSLRLEKTLTRLASDRVRPLLKPSNLVPKRAPPSKPYQDSTWQFTEVVEAIAEKIMQDYRAAVAKGEGTTKEELFESFQTSGQLAAYKEQLTPLVMKVVREKFLCSPDASEEVMSELTNELYVYLMDCVHTTLNKTTVTLGRSVISDAGRVAAEAGAEAEAAVGAPHPVEEDLSGVTERTWLERAEEAETLREYGQAAKCHQARIASCSSSANFAAVWTDAANFFVRTVEATHAEECYREAIAHDPTYVAALLGYGDLLLAHSRFEEAAVYLHAAADVAADALCWGHISLLCDLHVLALEQGPQYEAKRAYWEREGALAMKEAMGATVEVDYNEVSLAVSDYLLRLHHPELANVCLSRCRSGPKTEVLYARLFMLCEQYEEALTTLSNAEGLESCADAVGLLRGECHASLGHNDEAVREYKQVLCREDVVPDRRFGPSYIHLGNLLIAAGRYADALGVFTLGIQAWPCSLMWLGAGIAYYRMRRLDAAEECLSESNTLNNINPRTWAYLALVCLHKDRVELEMVLQQAIMQGLSDAALLTELGRDLVRASYVKLGEGCLRKAIAIEKDAGRANSAKSCTAMYYLAGAIEGARQQQAKDMYAEVVRHSQNEFLRARAEEQMQLLSK
ncbi:putative tetratricopeptide repeat protein 18-like [Trypanosoma conorhini]|uniref:Putative tetratricopeptide repeat protein 18-like n=1 Tax=Trypanosoma conorhini TaxID=83891 RepID=A0A3R7LCW2_9TRYP|nr:putative tetratricopeptide repeat protein 18-like [Trypanosoma conorhini]RNF21074.1 putative tetratricopeptide repeat protein 18-like [Trypanosoma conorhini]